jgi:YhcH/YjgK/YiaL family protein
MVIDSLNNSHLYYGLGEKIAKALRYLQESDFSKVEPGDYEIDGSNIIAKVQQYNSKPLAEGVWEAHRRYIDIQYVADGIERIGYANINKMKITKKYDESEDYCFLEGEGNFLTFRKGEFTILFPDDVHMPSCSIGGSKPVKKVVVKVLFE